MNSTEIEEQGETYPGVGFAYDFVFPSYGWMLTRLEAGDNRIQAIQVLAASVTFSIPAAIKVLNPDITFSAPRFLIAMLAFVALMVIGIVARVRGGVKLANPLLLYQKWLHLSEWEFKKDAVYWAGEHFQANARQVEVKARTAMKMMALFLVELLFLFAWVVTAG